MIRSRTVCSRSRLRPEEAGFVLLLAFFGALVLLLSSLSIQTAALQSRTSEFTLRLRRQREDALFSAAQLVLAQLQQHRCVLTLPLADWPTSPQADCLSAVDRARLVAGQLPEPETDIGTYQLVGYEPAYRFLPDPDNPAEPSKAVLEGADLTLEWRSSRGGSDRRNFRVLLVPDADLLQPPKLRGIQP